MKSKKDKYFVELKNKVIKKKINVGIIGLGYVGLPLALTISEKGIKVIGFDINKNYVNSINNGESYIHHIDSKRIKKQNRRGKLFATEDFKEIKKTDVIVICVPTPLNDFREPDLSFINNTMINIKDFLKKGQLLILESTTYPGTTEEKIKPFLEKQGLKTGENIYLAYSPEREDPGNTIFKTENTPKVLGGITKKCTFLGKIFYESFVKDVFTVSSTRAAEMTKLVENVQRAVNIGLVNELKLISESLNIDIYEIIRAASTKPFGFTPFFPGPGLGGHCIPIDPFYLSWKAKEYGMNLKFIELAGEINSSMPNYVVNKISEYFNNNCKTIKNSKIIILGLSYKKNIDDLRESPSLKIADLLIKLGAEVSYSDPYFEILPKLRNYNINIKNVNLTPSNLSKFDCTILATDHDAFDYDLVKEFSSFIIDTRGRFELQENIIRG